MSLEIAVFDVAGLRAAHRGGADRVEVSAALAVTGGITPSAGVVEAMVEAALLPVHVLIRPRPGDFTFDSDEVDSMIRDIRVFRAIGVAGCVIGAVTEGGRLDEVTLSRLSEAAEGLEVTWHRMVDALPHPEEAAARASDLGAGRILTSGGASTAIEGIRTLEAMVSEASGRVQIMAGGGVRPNHIRSLVSAGVDGIHMSASKQISGGPVGPGGGIAGRTVTDQELVSAASAAISVACVS